MAIASGGTLGTGTSSTSGTTITLTTGADLNPGDYMLLELVTDNSTTTDGTSNDHTSLTGGTGTVTKLGETTNGNGSAAAGVTTSLWLFRATALNASGTVFTCNLGTAVVDKVASAWRITTFGTLVLSAEPATNPVNNVTDASNGYGSVAFSGLISKPRLYIRALGKQANSATGITVSSGFTATTAQRSRNNAAAVMVRGEFRINTSTGETSNPTLAVSGDTAAVFAVLEEVGATIPDQIVQIAPIGANTGGFSMATVHASLNSPTLLNNTVVIILGFSDNTASISSIVDDNGNSYTADESRVDAGNGYQATILRVNRAATGTLGFLINFTTTAQFVSGCILELWGIADTPLDGHNNNGSSSLTWPTGSFTPGTNGGLVIGAHWSDQQAGYGDFKPQADFSLIWSEKKFGFAVQAMIQTTAAAINPTMTASGSSGAFIALGVCYKTDATKGTAPSGPRIFKRQLFPVHDATATSFSFQFPCKGDLIDGGWLGASSASATRAISTFVDTQGNVYTIETGTGNGQAGLSQHAHKHASTPSSLMVLTLTTTADNASSIMLWDYIRDGHAIVFDKIANASGLASGSGDLTMATITPSYGNGVIFGVGGINAGTTRDAVQPSGGGGPPAFFYTDHCWGDTEDGNTDEMHEDNPWGHVYPANTNPVTFVYGTTQPPEDWSQQLAAFNEVVSTVAPQKAPYVVTEGVKRKKLTPHGFYITPAWIRQPGVNGVALLGALSGVGTAIARASATGAGLLASLTGSGTAGTAGSASGIATLPALVGSGTAVTGIAAAPPLHPQVIVTEFTRERRRRQEKADRSLASPILQLITYQTPAGAQATGTATLASLAGTGTAKAIVHATGAATVTLAASGTAKAPASASDVQVLIPGLRGVGTATGTPAGAHATGTATLPALTGVGTAKAPAHVTGVAPLAILVGAGQAQAKAHASGAVVLAALRGIGTIGPLAGVVKLPTQVVFGLSKTKAVFPDA